MSHPRTSYQGAGRNDVAAYGNGGTTDSNTQTSSNGSSQHDRSSYISVNERTPLLGRRPTHQRGSINLGVLALGFLFIGGVTIGSYLLVIQDRPYQSTYPFDLVYRESWNAVDTIDRGPRLNNSLTQNVYIAHTGGSDCYSFEECARIVKNLQNNIINSSRNGTDLPYNFLIGSDGKTYEVRGWDYQMGLDSANLYPSTSLLIGLIGNFTHTVPDRKQIEEIKALLGVSQRRNKLSQDYNVFIIRNLTMSLVDELELISILQKKLDKFRYIIDVT